MKSNIESIFCDPNSQSTNITDPTWLLHLPVMRLRNNRWFLDLLKLVMFQIRIDPSIFKHIGHKLEGKDRDISVRVGVRLLMYAQSVQMWMCKVHCMRIVGKAYLKASINLFHNRNSLKPLLNHRVNTWASQGNTPGQCFQIFIGLFCWMHCSSACPLFYCQAYLNLSFPSPSLSFALIAFFLSDKPLYVLNHN